jgi:hypothetical protein
MQERPVLIHIGYHKTGTNWLQRHFFVPRTGLRWLGKSGEDHPVRRIVKVSPLEFDAAATRADFDHLLRQVEAEGLLPVVSFERLSGHPFSGGYDSKEIADRLAATFPGGRILVVIREQRSMIVSTYKQYVKAGGPSSLRRFLEPPASRSMRVPWFAFRHFEYDHLLRHYRALFGAEAVLALPFEQFVREPPAFVAEIGRFAGRPVEEEVLASLPYDAKSNPAPSAIGVALERRRNRLAVRSELNPAPVFESGPMKRLTKVAEGSAIESLLPRRLAARSEASLREAVAEIVGNRYAESNRRTAELTGIDLGAYGWTV